MKRLFLILIALFVTVTAASAQTYYYVPAPGELPRPEGNNNKLGPQGGRFYFQFAAPVRLNSLTAHTLSTENGSNQLIDMDTSWLSLSFNGNTVEVTVAPLTTPNRTRNASIYFGFLNGDHYSAWIVSQQNPLKITN